MPLLPDGTPLGRLEMLEVFEYYDIPCLFACRSSVGQIYLAVWVAEGEGANTWLYVPLSHRRYQMVRSGGLELREAFAVAEGGIVFRVSVPKRQGQATVQTVTCGALVDTELPNAGESLDLPTQTLPTRPERELAVVATQTRSDVVQLDLSVPTHTRSEAPADLLGRVLQAFQDCIDAIAQAVAGEATARGPISPVLREKARMMVFGTSGGSFSVQLRATERRDLVGYSLVGDAIEQFCLLLKSGDDADALRERLHGLRSRSAAKYRLLLNHMVSAGAGVDIVWASPIEDRTESAQLPPGTAASAVNVVSQIEAETEEPYTFVGNLYALNLHQSSFGVENVEEGEDYYGRIADEALPALSSSGVTVGRLYRVTIREQRQYNALTGEEKTKYRLLGLEPVSPDEPQRS